VNWHHKPSCVLVTGKKGSGKTTYWLKRLVAHRARWKFIFDPRREASHKLKLPICIDHPQMTRAVIEGRPVCYDSSLQFPGDRREGFAFFTRFVFNVCKELRGSKLMACDEFQGVQKVGDNGLPQGFKEITDEGRREEIDNLLSAQRLNEVNDDVRSQLTELVCFKHTDSLTLDWIERTAEDMGCPFDRGAVANLPTPGRYIRFSDDGKVSTDAGTRKKPIPAGA